MYTHGDHFRHNLGLSSYFGLNIAVLKILLYFCTSVIATNIMDVEQLLL